MTNANERQKGRQKHFKKPKELKYVEIKVNSGSNSEIIFEFDKKAI